MLGLRQLLLGTAALTACVSSSRRSEPAAPSARPVVRLAELEIDPAQIDRYLTFLRDEIATSIRVEPGVLTLYAVRLKSNPTHIRLFEMYADTTAYNAHIVSPHFTKYKLGTADMVKSLVLHETEPFLLGTKSTDVLSAYVSVH